MITTDTALQILAALANTLRASVDAAEVARYDCHVAAIADAAELEKRRTDVVPE